MLYFFGGEGDLHSILAIPWIPKRDLLSYDENDDDDADDDDDDDNNDDDDDDDEYTHDGKDKQEEDNHKNTKQKLWETKIAEVNFYRMI